MLVLCFAFAFGGTQGQGFNYFNFSLLPANTYCPMPANISVKALGIYYAGNNVPCPDSFLLQVIWGDGNIDTIVGNFTGSGGTYCYFNMTQAHQYTIPGLFQAGAKFIYPTGPNNQQVSPYFHISSFCTNVEGTIYNDTNYNCQLDTNETTFANVAVVTKDSSDNLLGIGFTDSNGYYNSKVTGGMVNCKTSLAPQAITSCSSTGAYIHTTFNDTTIDFGVNCNDDFDVYSLHGLTGVEAPGDTGVATVRIYAISCDSASIFIRAQIAPQLTYIGMIDGPEPDSVKGKSLYWTTSFSSAGMLGVGQLIHYAQFRVRTNTTANIGSRAYFNVIAIADRLEANPNNNNHQWSVIIDGPYDPNNKLVTPEGVGPNGNIPPSTTLNYTVNFQNTGTDTARHIFVIDTLSEYVDLSTISIIESSHTMKVAYYADRVLRFDFRNIYLPDSGASLEGSKGYFMFSVDTKENLNQGTQISNLVDIYFDYNPPIRTNATLNTIDYGIKRPEIVLTAGDNRCVNNDVGFVNLELKNGTPPFTYIWNPKLPELENDSLSSGVYAVTVIDSNLYMDMDTIVVHDERTNNPNPEFIEGALEVFPDQPNKYAVEETPQSVYLWTVTNGDITVNNGSQIKVLWHDSLNGSVTVQETDSLNCIGENRASILIYPLGISSSSNPWIKIYPNPTSQFIHIETNFPSSSDVLIHDENGRLVRNETISMSSNTLNIKDLKPGIYTLEIRNDQHSESFKIVID